jgi:hypothetical protein
MTDVAMVCYGPSPKAHLCDLDRAILRVLANLRGIFKRAGLHARYVDQQLGRLLPLPWSVFPTTIQAVCGALRRLQRLGYVQRTNTGAWRLA